jgi:hypothetical protein
VTLNEKQLLNDVIYGSYNPGVKFSVWEIYNRVLGLPDYDASIKKSTLTGQVSKLLLQLVEQGRLKVEGHNTGCRYWYTKKISSLPQELSLDRYPADEILKQIRDLKLPPDWLTSIVQLRKYDYFRLIPSDFFSRAFRRLVKMGFLKRMTGDSMEIVYYQLLPPALDEEAVQRFSEDLRKEEAQRSRCTTPKTVEEESSTGKEPTQDPVGVSVVLENPPPPDETPVISSPVEIVVANPDPKTDENSHSASAQIEDMHQRTWSVCDQVLKPIPRRVKNSGLTFLDRYLLPRKEETMNESVSFTTPNFPPSQPTTEDQPGLVTCLPVVKQGVPQPPPFIPMPTVPEVRPPPLQPKQDLPDPPIPNPLIFPAPNNQVLTISGKNALSLEDLARVRAYLLAYIDGCP